MCQLQFGHFPEPLALDVMPFDVALKGCVPPSMLKASKALLRGWAKQGTNIEKLLAAIRRPMWGVTDNIRTGVFHGTNVDFDEFEIRKSGVHFGTRDQAAHVASQKMGRYGVHLAEDENGWCGRLIKTKLHAVDIKFIEDQCTDLRWSVAIDLAERQGYQAIAYINKFEGRELDFSVVVWDESIIEIVDRDVTRPEPESALNL